MQLHRAILVDDEPFTRKGLMKLIDWETCGFQIVGKLTMERMRLS